MESLLSEAELAAGCAEILWRLRVSGVLVVPPYVGSFVARHIVHNWAAEEKHGEGEVLVKQLLEFARRARLLLLPIQSESHWTLLAVERQTQQSHEQPLQPQAQPTPNGGCAKCRWSVGGCALCDLFKAVGYQERIGDENRFFDPITHQQPIQDAQPWVAVRYYDTLDKPSEKSAELAVGVLHALQRDGLTHHLKAGLLAAERYSMRRQKGCS